MNWKIEETHTNILVRVRESKKESNNEAIFLREKVLKRPCQFT
jgi:hypothetical protein